MARKPRPPAPGFSPEVCHRIVELIAAGNYLETAAGVVGIPPMTVRDWIREGTRRGTGEWFDFANEVRAAIARAEATGVMEIGRAGRGIPSRNVECPKCHAVVTTEPVPGQWTALAWRLERGPSRERWKRPDLQVNVNVRQTPEWTEMLSQAAAFLAEKHPEAADDLLREFSGDVIEVKALPEAEA